MQLVTAVSLLKLNHKWHNALYIGFWNAHVSIIENEKYFDREPKNIHV